MGNLDQTPKWLARLLEEHGRALVLYARQWCDCPEDVVQEALLQLISQRRPPERLVPWVYRVVRNGAISASRQTQRRVRREMQTAASEAWFEVVSSALDAQEAKLALTSLALELREPVVARIWAGLTFAEIAELAGTSLSTAQRRYEQGIQELQARLEKPCTTETQRDATS
jgi:RNA polymerase sigma factor (sigma-70 family)